VTAATLNPASTSAPTGHPSAGVIGGAHSAGSERTVVSAALRPEKAHLLPGLMSVLGGSDFFVEAHAVIWDCARAIADLGQEVDAVKLLDYANSKQLFVGGPEYVVALLDDPLCQNTTDKTITEAATRVKEYSVTRLLDITLKRGRELCSTAAEPPQSIIARVEDDLINLKTMGASSRRGPKKLVTILDAVLEHIQNVQDGQAPLALPTTFCAIDALIDGLYDEDLIVLAARPSMGKTSLLLGMAKGRAKTHNRPQLIFSCESRDLSLATRVLASEAHVASSDIRNARLDGEAMDRISGALHQIADLPIWIDDTPGLTIHEIRARARAFVAQHGKCDIWVDYLQKIAMSVDGKGRSSERNEHVGEASSALKLLARELGVPVIALSQLSRNLESRANKRPMMSDLRESGQIEQDADVIMFIYRDEVYNADSKEPGVAEIIVAKQREGAIGTAKLGWASQSTTFYDLRI
jgi:replicative DNA helicase